MLLIYLVAGWIAGIFAAALFQLPSEIWLVLLLLPIFYLLLFIRDHNLRIWHGVLIAFIVGALWFQFRLPSQLDQELAQFNEQGHASLLGIVAASPDVRDTQALVSVDVSKIQTGGQWLDTHGRALVSVPRDTAVQSGDEVQVDGSPSTPPDGADFSYRDYLARQDVFTLVKYARLYVVSSGHGNSFWTQLYQLKDAAQTAVNQLLPEPSASLLSGILLGNDNGIPSDVRDAFNNTNTAHIIAISGYNIAILVAVVAFVFRRPAQALKSRPLTFLSTIFILIFLVLYTLLVGASASVVRACIMGMLAVIAWQLGRQNWALTSLAASAFVMSLLNPYALWDVGFQLSFLATLGIVLFVPRLENRFQKIFQTRRDETRAQRILKFLEEICFVTVAAFVATAPLLVLYFHRLSLIGFVTNFLVLPAQPPIMLFGGAATMLQMAANALSGIPVIGPVLYAVAQGLAWVAYIFLQYTILVVQASAAVPFGTFELAHIALPLVILIYVLIFSVALLDWKRVGQLMVTHIELPVSLLAVGTIFVWTTGIAASNSQTRIMFLNAEGDSAFIRTASDQRILIDGTNEPSVLLNFLGEQLPFWDRRVDVVIATHLDDENLASLNEVLERYNIAQAVEPPAPKSPSPSFEKWRELIKKNQLSDVSAQAGVELTNGDMTIEIVEPTALKIIADGHTILFAPASGASERKSLSADGESLKADIAVLPEDIDKEFLKRVSPTSVILFVGDRPQDKPTKDTLELLQGAKVLRTDEQGTIQYSFDGRQTQVTTTK